MIVQVRGTSGSGKSTVMRAVMMAMGDWQSVQITGRKRPLYYLSASEWPLTAVLGHYESPCGGCDTVGSAAAVYDLIQKVVANGAVNVLCEGLLLSEDVKWSSQLPDLKVIFLTTPLERCLRQIECRRATVGNDKPLNPDNTANRVAVIERARVKLLDRGITCRRASPEQAPRLIMEWLDALSS